MHIYRNIEKPKINKNYVEEGLGCCQRINEQIHRPMFSCGTEEE